MKAWTKKILLPLCSSCHHAQIQEFLSGRGGGVQAQRPENSLDNVFILVFNLFYSTQRESKYFITEKTLLFQGSRGGPTFSGGGGGSKFFRGKKLITCDFPGGGSDPLSPLWIRTWPC